MQTARFFVAPMLIRCAEIVPDSINRPAGALSWAYFSPRVVKEFGGCEVAVRFAPAGANTPPYRDKTAKGWATRICDSCMTMEKRVGAAAMAWPKTGFRS